MAARRTKVAPVQPPVIPAGNLHVPEPLQNGVEKLAEESREAVVPPVVEAQVETHEQKPVRVARDISDAELGITDATEEHSPSAVAKNSVAKVAAPAIKRVDMNADHYDLPVCPQNNMKVQALKKENPNLRVFRILLNGVHTWRIMR